MFKPWKGGRGTAILSPLRGLVTCCWRSIPGVSPLAIDLRLSEADFKSVATWVVAAATVIYAILCILPWQPWFPSSVLDAAWRSVINEACCRHWRFGEEIVFTYGAWGYVGSLMYHPELYGTSLAGQGMLVGLLIVSLWRGVTAGVANPWRRMLLGAGVSLVVTEMVAREPTQLGYLLLWQLPLIQFFVDPPANEGARGCRSRVWRLVHDYGLVVAAALLSLTKFSLFPLAMAMVGGVSLDDVLCRRRFPWRGMVFVLAVAGFWLLARQPLTSLVPYVKNSLAVAMGYVEMKWSGPKVHIPWYALTAAGTLTLVGMALWPTRRWSSLIPLLTLGAALEVIAKSAFVRHDLGHWPMAFYFLAGCWLTAGPFLWQAIQSPRHRHLLRITGVMALAGAVLFSPGRWSTFASNVWATAVNRVHLPALAVRVIFGHAGYPATFERASAALRQQFPLPPLQGTVDLYPTAASVALAHASSYCPRPVFQSYSAYTPGLAALNAEHLRGPRAADNILFDIDPLDSWAIRPDHGRFPSLDDGLSWPELLTRYDVAPVQSGPAGASYLWLRRSPSPRAYRLDAVESRTMGFEEIVTLPSLDEGPLWAEIEVSRSALGVAATAALKDPIVRIVVVTCDRKETVYRLPAGMSRAGFLLSPLIDDRTWFAHLAATPWNDPKWQQAIGPRAVKSIRVTSRWGEWAFHPMIALRLFRLKFEPMPASPWRFGSGASKS